MRLTPQELVLAYGDSETLIVYIEPEAATNQEVSWSSDDATIATVDDNGVVTAVGEGTATIMVTTDDGGHSDSASVTVTPLSVTGVSVTPHELILADGDSKTLRADIEPENATDQEVSWSSDDDSIATVDGNGVVTAVGPGETRITVTTNDGGFSDTLTLTVPTSVGGTINEDVTWRASDSPFWIASAVQIAESATLTIEPGSEFLSLPSGSNIIEVWGALHAIGSAGHEIVFSGTMFVNNEGFINLTHVTARDGNLASPLTSQLVLRHSTIENFDGVSIFIDRSSLIEHNIFLNLGSLAITGARDSAILNNYFEGYGPSLFTYTSVTETIKIHRNTFVESDAVVFEVRKNFSGGDLDARHNYWGTSDEERIRASILDNNDDLNRSGEIIYSPFLTDPHPDTPTPD